MKFFNFLGLSWIAITLLSVTGCGQLPAFQVGAKTDFQEQSSAPLEFKDLDLLFVVDNSGSMADEQQNLADSFDSFITQFAARDLNFHIGVVSTDTRPLAGNTSYWNGTGWNSCGRPYQGIYNNGPGTLLSKYSSYKYLTPSVPNYIDKFKDNVLLGTCGSGQELGLMSTMMFFDPARIGGGGYNEGFMRPDAFLAVIIVSDEDESRSSTDANYVRNYSSEYTTRINAFKAQFEALKPDNRELLRVDAIVAPSAPECPSLLGVGTAYMAMATEYGGQISNICQDFSSSLASIGTEILTYLTRFALLQPPSDSEVQVSVNGVSVEQDETNGWVLIQEGSKYFVEFRGTAIPNNGDKIGITYVPSAPSS